MNTKKNLQEAFKGESAASKTYELFSEKAKKEGYENLARLFKAAAFSESVHAENHLKAAREIGDSIENLKKAISGEAYEIAQMYPSFIQLAKDEGQDDAVRTFEWAYETEKAHKDYFEEALNAIQEGKDIETEEIAVCKGCGFTMVGEIPERCPICGAPKSRFELF